MANRPLFAAAVLFLTTTLAFCADPILGDTVAAKWPDGFYYLATIAQVHDGKFDVNYADGDKATLTPAEVIPLPPGPLEIGAHVLACWKGARMYPGVITGKADLTYTIKWDDGDAPLDVVRTRVVPFEKADK